MVKDEALEVKGEIVKIEEEGVQSRRRLFISRLSYWRPRRRL